VCRGQDFRGQATEPDVLQPGLAGSIRAIAIAMSNTMGFALLSNGSVVAWGEPATDLPDMYPVTSLTGDDLCGGVL
jgi:hypothetical protein